MIMALMIVGILLTIALIMLIVVGIRDYRKNPKPPAGLSYHELRKYYYTRAWEEEKSIIEYLEAGQKVQAIKELQAQTGCSLAAAKEAVEQLEISIQRRMAMQSDSDTF
jgi:hypothetical protein